MSLSMMVVCGQDRDDLKGDKRLCVRTGGVCESVDEMPVYFYNTKTGCVCCIRKDELSPATISSPRPTAL